MKTGKTTSRRFSDRGAFTLIELLVVMAIGLLLAGMLFPALKAARDYARRTIALGEIKALESAWKQYYSEYRMWPSFMTGIVEAVGMSGDVARVLQTRVEVTPGFWDNAKAFRFMEFNKVNESGDPINPWGDSRETSVGSEHAYFVKIDADFDNVIPAGTADDPPEEDLNRSVIVWTRNVPVGDPDEDNYYIGSW
jgi:prepilin-type N-terminal cleavage/methylation domain-containing protein